MNKSLPLPILNTLNADQLAMDIKRHIVSTLGNDYTIPRKDILYNGLAYAIRDRLLERWINSQKRYYDRNAKRVYYLSLEFLPGRFLMNYIINMGLEKICNDALGQFNMKLSDLQGEERDPGLGNGGLGRLASCFLDSIACLNIPGYGYGIRYDYGIFYQKIENGYQVEECDNWLQRGNPWEIKRMGYQYEIQFYGKSESYTNENDQIKYRWVNTDKVGAVACDMLIPSYGNDNVVNMRLWAAEATKNFNLTFFNKGQYIKAMENKVLSENISKVLYPGDELEGGKELRLRQQYFFVAATFQDIIRRFKKKKLSFTELPNYVSVQLNDTHPSISIPELMRILLDEENYDWETSWDICTKTFGYTNHTILPEALENWPVEIISKMLPRHLDIIYEINYRFLKGVESYFPNDPQMISKLSIIQEYPEKSVRMAHLSVIGSHKVNGVSKLHSHILKTKLFKDFNVIFPNKLINITNGITPRRWLLQSNSLLSDLISSTIGTGWINNLEELEKLIPYSDNPQFQAKWRFVKEENKKLLVNYIQRHFNVDIDYKMLFDIQVKRIHEYKRQLLNVFHAITVYNRIKDHGPSKYDVPRVIIIGGKAAPGYYLAKLIIKLINSVADVINQDPEVNPYLKVVFLPNYCVTLAEKLVPACDLSEQISTAGTEASGTGNMKFALNGALTIGTYDGANIEIMDKVGDGNIFIFGLRIEEIEQLKLNGYNLYDIYNNNLELKKIINMIDYGYFSPENSKLFTPIKKALFEQGDRYFIFADYCSFVEKQNEVSKQYLDNGEWTRRSILNTANMGHFSSDRAVLEYTEKVWNLR